MSSFTKRAFTLFLCLVMLFAALPAATVSAEEIDVSEKSCYKTDMAKIYITK